MQPLSLLVRGVRESYSQVVFPEQGGSGRNPPDAPREHSLTEAVFGGDGLIAQGIYHLRKQPILVFSLLVVVLIVALFAVASATDAATRNVVPWILGFAAFTLLLFFVLSFVDPEKRSKETGLVELRTVKRVDNPAPPMGEEGDEKEAEIQVMLWLEHWSEEARIVVDAGTDRSVEVGDYFVVIRNPDRATGLRENQIGNLKDDAASQVKVVRVYATESVCRLEGFAYTAYFQELEQAGHDFATLPGPVVPGQRVLAVPRAEKAYMDVISNQYAKTLGNDVPAEKRLFHLEEMVRAARTLLTDHPSGWFAADALFQRAYAEFELGRFREARESFDEFLDRYPFHVSARGARTWLTKAEDALRARGADES